MVYLVGAGPGDPDLLTVKALRVLQTADVVLYDRLVSDQILALIPRTAEAIYAGKFEGEQEQIQQFIFDLLLAYGHAGRTVVRLKGGDPMVFGRGGEEWLKLTQAGVPVEVIPGVSSALAVPALAEIPVTFRGKADGFAVVTGHLRPEGGEIDWSKYARVDTLVILMGVKHRARIAAELVTCGRPANTPVAFIERGSTPEQRVIETTLGDVAAGRVAVSNPAVWVSGEVVRFRESLRSVTDAVQTAA
jgi:uroporphyrin-III C-methyltransferase